MRYLRIINGGLCTPICGRHCSDIGFQVILRAEDCRKDAVWGWEKVSECSPKK
jgi:hypothetical protein